MAKVKYDWSLAEPYLDVELDNGSRNRQTQHITLRQFKQHVEDGVGIRQFKTLGISKHIVQFFSNFCQGNGTRPD